MLHTVSGTAMRCDVTRTCTYHVKCAAHCLRRVNSLRRTEIQDVCIVPLTKAALVKQHCNVEVQVYKKATTGRRTSTYPWELSHRKKHLQNQRQKIGCHKYHIVYIHYSLMGKKQNQHPSISHLSFRLQALLDRKKIIEVETRTILDTKHQRTCL